MSTAKHPWLSIIITSLVTSCAGSSTPPPAQGGDAVPKLPTYVPANAQQSAGERPATPPPLPHASASSDTRTPRPPVPAADPARHEPSSGAGIQAQVKQQLPALGTGPATSCGPAARVSSLRLPPIPTVGTHRCQLSGESGAKGLVHDETEDGVRVVVQSADEPLTASAATAIEGREIRYTNDGRILFFGAGRVGLLFRYADDRLIRVERAPYDGTAGTTFEYDAAGHLLRAFEHVGTRITKQATIVYGDGCLPKAIRLGTHGVDYTYDGERFASVSGLVAHYDRHGRLVRLGDDAYTGSTFGYSGEGYPAGYEHGELRCASLFGKDGMLASAFCTDGGFYEGSFRGVCPFIECTAPPVPGGTAPYVCVSYGDSLELNMWPFSGFQ